jgi:hypothetical protein
MSALTTVFDGAQLVAGPFFGAIASVSDLRTTFAVGALMPLAGLFAFRWLERRHPPRAALAASAPAPASP